MTSFEVTQVLNVISDLKYADVQLVPLVHQLLKMMTDSEIDSIFWETLNVIDNVASFQKYGFCQGMEDNEMKSFILWCLNRLIYSTITLDLSYQLISVTSQCAASLLGSLSRRYLMEEYFNLVNCLISSFIEVMFAIEEKSVANVNLSDLQSESIQINNQSQPINLEYATLSLESIEIANKYCALIIGIIQHILPTFASFRASQLKALFSALSFAVDIGNIVMKRLSWSCLNILIDYYSIESDRQHIDYFISMVARSLTAMHAPQYFHPDNIKESGLQCTALSEVLRKLTHLFGDSVHTDKGHYPILIIHICYDFIVFFMENCKSPGVLDVCQSLYSSVCECLAQLVNFSTATDNLPDIASLPVKIVTQYCLHQHRKSALILILSIIDHEQRIEEDLSQSENYFPLTGMPISGMLHMLLDQYVTTLFEQSHEEFQHSVVSSIYVIIESLVLSMIYSDSSHLKNGVKLSDLRVTQSFSSDSALKLMNWILSLHLWLPSFSCYNEAIKFTIVDDSLRIMKSLLLADKLGFIKGCSDASFSFQGLSPKITTFLLCWWLVQEEKPETWSLLNVNAEESKDFRFFKIHFSESTAISCLTCLALRADHITVNILKLILQYNSYPKFLSNLCHLLPRFYFQSQDLFESLFPVCLKLGVSMMDLEDVARSLFHSLAQLVCAYSETNYECMRSLLHSADDQPANLFSSVNYLYLRCKLCDDTIDLNCESVGKVFCLKDFSNVISRLQDAAPKIKMESLVLIKNLFLHIDWRFPDTEVLGLIRSLLFFIREDPYQLRMEFSECFEQLGSRLSLDATKWKLLEKEVFLYLNETLDMERISIIETLVNFYGILARCGSMDCLPKIIVKLCECILIKEHSIQGFVRRQIDLIKQHRKLSPVLLLSASKEELSHMMVDQPEDSFDSMFQIFCKGFSMTRKEFYQEMITPIFIALIVKKSPQSNRRFHELILNAPYLSTQLGYIDRLKQLCIMPETLVYLFTRVNATEQQDHHKFLEKMFDTPIKILACMNDVTRLLHLFILQLHKYHNRVYSAIRWIAVDLLGRKQNAFGQEEISEFLSDHTCGILAVFDCKLLEKSLPQEKMSVLQSLDSFIKLVGKSRVTRMRTKFMATLKVALRVFEEELAFYTCNVWETFIENLEGPCLGTLLSEIGAALIKLNQHSPLKVAKLLENKILKNKFIPVDQLAELHFILDIPNLVNCHSALLKVIVNSLSSDLENYLHPCIFSIEHESSFVRFLGLKRCYKIFELYPKQLSLMLADSLKGSDKALCNNSDSPQYDLIGKLMKGLLHGCKKDSDHIMRTLYAMCLGRLGALDPGRFGLSTNKRLLSKKGDHVFCDDHTFSYAVLAELGKVYLRSTNSQLLDSTALAIQELLKICEVTQSIVGEDSYPLSNCSSFNNRKRQLMDSNTEEESLDGLLKGRELWNMFLDHMQQLFTPLLQGKYKVSAFTEWINLATPIFLKRKRISYSSWLCVWTASLNEHIESTPIKNIFLNCEAVTKSDLEFASFLLVPAALQILIDNNEKGIRKLLAEVQAVLNCAAKQSPIVGNLQSVPPALEYCNFTQTAAPDVRMPLGQSDPDNVDSDDPPPWYEMATQTVLHLLDSIQVWAQRRRKQMTAKANSSNSSDQKDCTDPVSDRVKRFLSAIPHDMQAEASFECGSMARALQQWEMAYYSSSDSAEKQSIALNGMLFAYSKLDEPDGIAGVLAITKQQSESNVRTLELQNSGQLELVFPIYEEKIQSVHNDLESSKITEENALKELLSQYEGLFSCQTRDVSQLAGAMERISSLESKDPAYLQTLNTYRVQAAWKLGRWDELESALQKEESLQDWNIGIGTAFLAIKKEDCDKFYCTMNGLRIGLMKSLTAAAMESSSYERVYDSVLKLAMLTEMEIFAESTQLIKNEDNGRNSLSLQDLHQLLHQRLEWSTPSYQIRESLLSLRHSLLQLYSQQLPGDSVSIKSFLRNAIRENWLLRAKIARKAQQYKAAYSCILKAEFGKNPEIILEKAKLFWTQDKKEEAQRCLDQGLSEMSVESVSTYLGKTQGDDKKKKIHSKVMLLRAHYSAETSRFDYNEICKLYNDVCSSASTSEEAHFRFAKYIDRTRSHVTGQNQKNLLKLALENYGTALQYGSKFIYQSMPRLLSIWLDDGSDINSSEFAETVKKIMQLNINRIPAFQFYTALGQILPRLCHPNPAVAESLCDLVVRIFLTYPDQTIWFLLAYHESQVEQRKQKCSQLFHMIKSKKKDLSKFIEDSVTLCQLLRSLCSFTDERISVLTSTKSFPLNTMIPAMSKILKSGNFSRLLIPLHSQLIPILPTSQDVSIKNHTAFSNSSVYLVGFGESVDILASLTKPKRMTWIGSDGQRYYIVCKPKDDLRYDWRLMEQNAMINKFLVRNTETRRRQLQIRTYAVIPLSEEGGLLEWVNNLECYRTILYRIYNEMRVSINMAKLKKEYPLKDDDPEVKRNKYVNNVIPLFPLVFHKWFLQNFPNPSAWYSARICYGRTSAVMSIVGYVIGLGDRHGENILLDCTTGETVHVDFNCVLNHGLTLPVPEVVPFRLTRNMIDAMGATGYEGVFRRSCEVVMRLLRREIDPLMAVFRPIYFDSILEKNSEDQAKNKRLRTSRKTIEEKTTLCQLKLKKMEDRLIGKMTDRGAYNQLPMSVEGQVDALIKEATDDNNLCKMFVGWAPYL